MKRIFTSLLAVSVLLLLPSCRFIKISDSLKQEMIDDLDSPIWDEDGAVPYESEEAESTAARIDRNEVTGEFHSLTCNIPGNVIYTPGDCAFSINGPENILRHITVQNDNGTLVVKSDGTPLRNVKNLNVTLSSPVLEQLTFNGAVDFKAPKGITALDFDMDVNGAGDLSINGLTAGKARLTVNGAGDASISGLDCDKLTVAINGAGDATLSGTALAADLSISGAGDIDAKNLKCDDISSKVRGIGHIRRP